jgi:CDGSH-type Zn-finger protein
MSADALERLDRAADVITDLLGDDRDQAQLGGEGRAAVGRALFELGRAYQHETDAREGLLPEPADAGHASTPEDEERDAEYVAALIREGREHDERVKDGPARTLLCGCGLSAGSPMCATHAPKGRAS